MYLCLLLLNNRFRWFCTIKFLRSHDFRGILVKLEGRREVRLLVADAMVGIEG